MTQQSLNCSGLILVLMAAPVSAQDLGSSILEGLQQQPKSLLNSDIGNNCSRRAESLAIATYMHVDAFVVAVEQVSAEIARALKAPQRDKAPRLRTKAGRPSANLHAIAA